MAGAALEDAEVQTVLDRILPSAALDDPAVYQGNLGTAAIGHVTVSLREFFSNGLNDFHLFLGRSGLSLLKLASDHRARIAALSAAAGTPGGDTYEDIADLPSGGVLGGVWVYVEIDAGSGLLANRALTLVVPPTMTRADAEDSLREMHRLLPGLPSALGLGVTEFRDRLDAALDEAFPGVVGRAFDVALEGLADLFDIAEDGAKALANFLETKARMPKELWSPRHRPDDWAAFLRTLKADQTQVLDRVEAGLAGPQFDVLVRLNTAGRFLPPDLRRVLERVKDVWIGLFDLIRGTIAVLRDMKPDLDETADAVLGYVSGFWDGIVDAILGFVEMLALGLKLAAANLRLHKGLSAAFQAAMEFFETAFAALERIDYAALWDWVQRAWPFLWEAAWTRAEWAVDKVVSSSAQAGYYFGYLVYMVVEFFLPPLKATSLLKNARRLASMEFLRKVVA